jgi:acylphosphatase
VQGVGFRWYTRARALELGLVGVARNLPDGRVVVVAEGDEGACRELLFTLSSEWAPGRVDHIVDQWGPAQGGLTGFVAS